MAPLTVVHTRHYLLSLRSPPICLGIFFFFFSFLLTAPLFSQVHRGLLLANVSGMPTAPFCSRTRGVMPQPAGSCFSFSFADHTPSLTGTWRSLLLSPSSRSALSLPLPLFSFWFIFFLLSFSFSFTADRCLSLTGAGTPSHSQMQGTMPHPPGSFFSLFFFHSLTASLMGTPPAHPFVAHRPCCIAITSVTLPSPPLCRPCCVGLVASLQVARLLRVARFKTRYLLWICGRNGGKGVSWQGGDSNGVVSFR